MSQSDESNDKLQLARKNKDIFDDEKRHRAITVGKGIC